MTTIRAHFDGKAFVPDEPVNVPVNQSVTLHFESAAEVTGPVVVEEQLKALAELEKMAEDKGSLDVDWSRENIYSGTLDDPR
jgi:hypothetical protein